MNNKIKTVFISLMFFLIFIGLLHSNMAYGATDITQFGVTEDKHGFVDLEHSKNDLNFVYDKNLDITEKELHDKLISSGYKISVHYKDGTVKTQDIDQGRFVFKSLSQTPIIYNGIIYVNFGWVDDSNRPFSGLMPIKITYDNNKYSFDIMFKSTQVPAYQLAKQEFFTTASTPLGEPSVIPKSGNSAIIVYVVSQWFIKYTVDDQSKLSTSNESFQDTVSPAMENSIGAGSVYTAANNHVYIGSWNGKIYKINPENMDYDTYNTRALPINDHVITNSKLTSEMGVITTTDNKKRIYWGLAALDTDTTGSGGLCTANLDLKDVRCTINDKYYVFNDNQTIKSSETLKNRSGNATGIDAFMENGASWSSRFQLLFSHDRWGIVYAFDAYGKMRYKNTTLKGSYTYGGVSLDKTDSYGYIKINSVRPSTSYNDFFTGTWLIADNCDRGRIFRIDTNQIVYLLNRDGDPNVLEQQTKNYGLGGDLRINSTIGDASSANSVIYSNADWVAQSALTGYPFILGETILAATAGCSGQGSSAIFAVNVRYDNMKTPMDPPSKGGDRLNASGNSSGRIQFVQAAKNIDNIGVDYINAMKMGAFSSSVGGFLFNDNFQEGIATTTGFGLNILYLQNGDFLMTDLSVTSNESDGKFYPRVNTDTGNVHKYDGHIRVISSNEEMYINPKVDLDNTFIEVKVHHTNNPIPNGTQDNFVCPTPNGTSSCKFNGAAEFQTTYTSTNLLNNTGSATNYSTKYRPLFTKKIPLRQLVTDKTLPDGSKMFVIEKGTVLVDEHFDVFKEQDAMAESNAEVHHLIAYIDITNSLEETDELNNLGYKQIKYEGSFKADLNLICEVPPPSSGYSYDLNTDYGINMKINNISDKAKVKKGFNYIIKQDGVVIKSGTIAPSSYPGSDDELQIGEYVNLLQNVRFTSSGNHNVQVQINPEGDTGNIPEADYSNNDCNVDMPTIIYSKPDLIGLSIGSVDDVYKFKFAGSTPVEGNPIVIRGIVQNIGQQRIDQDSNTYLKITRNGTTVTELFVPCKAILPGSGTCSLNVTLPLSSLQKGTYSLAMKADYGATPYDNGSIVEGSETNNWAYGSFIVTDVPNQPPNGYFSPNGGTIKDTIEMAPPSFSIGSYAVDYKIGIINSSGTMVRTLATRSTSFRFPNQGRNPHYYSPISSYYSNYLHYNDAYNSWLSVPRNSNGNYVWDGKNDSSIVVPDGSYSLVIRYTEENSSEWHHIVWEPSGCSYCASYSWATDADGNPTYQYCSDRRYYGCNVDKEDTCYYLTSTFSTNTNYGSTVTVDDRLELNNVEVKSLNPKNDNTLRGLDYILIPPDITTSLEASVVTVSIPANIINTSQLKNSTWTTSGGKVIINLVPSWSTYYNISDTFRCNGDPYCNKWRLADNDAIVLLRDVPDGTYTITFTAYTRLDTPDSPVTKDVVIRVQDSIYNHIKIEENK